MRNSETIAATSITSVPTANGSGAIGHERRLDVGVGVGQQGAGGVPLVPGQRQRQVAAGDRAAVAGLQPELHVAGAEPAAEDAGRPAAR